MHNQDYLISEEKNYVLKLTLTVFALLVASVLFSQTSIKGIVTDAKTGETLPGVAVSIKNTTQGVMSDADGNYELNVGAGKHTVVASYLSYSALEVTDVEVKRGEITNLNIPMQESLNALNEVVVVAMARINSEVSLLNSMKNANGIVSGVSSQQISRNQDRDASEVIRRIPGISIMDNKFIVARGLSQRYNNVWINNSATPSSEADSRSFSFDLIPSSQIENIMIVKSPQPELPADFSGGFVKVATKGIPSENSMEISYGTGFNAQTQFEDFKYNPGSSTDFLGFDNGHRSLRSIVPFRLDGDNTEMVDAVTKNGFNNNWAIKTKSPLPDQRFSFAMSRRINTEGGQQWGLTSAINYSYTSRTLMNMRNAQYEVYNDISDKTELDNDYSDNQYNTNARLGAMVNLSFISNKNNHYEFQNIFNQLGQDRYTFREGTDYTSGRSKRQERQEYLYSSRTTYSGQFTGKHTLSFTDKLDWTLGFSYANKNQPDRRMINRTENASTAEDPFNGQMYVSQADIERNFIDLSEYTYNAAANYSHDLKINSSITSTLKGGFYGEYKVKDYNTRDFDFLYNENYFPYSFRFGDVVKDILIPENFGANRLYINESTNNVDSYDGNNKLLAAYLAINIPYKKFNIYAGARFEHDIMTLTNFISPVGFETKDSEYKTTDVFPSLNVSYNLDKSNILRFAYGMSINRPEFREVSPASFYDFDLFNRIQGNPDLKAAYIQNLDLRYEFYPSSGELVSVALFYKHFENPIEWTFINTGGGSRIFTFENALSGQNLGVEIDLKKRLDFMGLKDFSAVINGSLIQSKVKFEENSTEDERPLQGQSPFLVNAGFFYQSEPLQLTAGLMYNIIGKRIVGIGLKSKSENSTVNDDIPDMYEMPRNVLDFTVTKRIGKQLEIAAAVKDIFSQDVLYKQFPKFIDDAGVLHERQQTTRRFNPGQNISLSAKFNF
ncbi:TonB-dependent receptor [Dysgonomonas alginatilytica]|uniref:TonB-dependent receptor n=1 Tax=Dysgonomonas alginatilytica TaxID=1605892 RepID=A0A2V3PKW4_9BACT|nr:TonB-dependent receptor [Dysgonomonas alginatilytica]PXV62126.1 TonB-dependent receptor [Dysgonomonas alginatilytica]